MSASRLVAAERRDDDVVEASLRPQRLSEFVGQENKQAIRNTQDDIDQGEE